MNALKSVARTQRVNSLTLRVMGSQSDVCRRQILTTEVDPETVSKNFFIMVVDP